MALHTGLSPMQYTTLHKNELLHNTNIQHYAMRRTLTVSRLCRGYVGCVPVVPAVSRPCQLCPGCVAAMPAVSRLCPGRAGCVPAVQSSAAMHGDPAGRWLHLGCVPGVFRLK